MSELTPRYRSFQKAYGGDPDSAVLKDLHKRVMRLEIDLASVLNRVKDNTVKVAWLAPPPPPEQINVAKDHGLADPPK